MLKSLGERLLGNKLFTSFQVSLHRLPFNYKGKNISLQWKDLIHCLHQVIKLVSIVEQPDIMCLPMWCIGSYKTSSMCRICWKCVVWILKWGNIIQDVVHFAEPSLDFSKVMSWRTEGSFCCSLTESWIGEKLRQQQRTVFSSWGNLSRTMCWRKVILIFLDGVMILCLLFAGLAKGKQLHA